MGVYIKGMKMPKPKLADMATVYYAYVLVSPNGHAVIVVDNEDGLDSTGYPLVTVPPHVDLVDKQRMTDEVRKHEKAAYDEVVALHKQKRFDATYEYYRGYSDGLITASGLVRFAPTIIPAEEDET